MGEIIDLDAVVPEDMVFKFRGQEYRLPGDIDVETVVDLVRITNLLARAEGLIEGVKQHPGNQRRYSNELEAIYLDLFKVHHPDLEELPFKSMAALSAIHGTVMVRLGFGSAEENGKGPLAPKKKRAMAVPKSRSRSRRTSTGSGGN